MRSSPVYVPAVLLAAAFASPARADDAACKNPDWAPAPMPGFHVDPCQHRDRDSVTVDAAAGDREIGARRDSVTFALGGAESPSAVEVRDQLPQEVVARVPPAAAADRMTTKGYGETKPLVPNKDDESRAKNRRVELTRESCS